LYDPIMWKKAVEVVVMITCTASDHKLEFDFGQSDFYYNYNAGACNAVDHS